MAAAALHREVPAGLCQHADKGGEGLVPSRVLPDALPSPSRAKVRERDRLTATPGAPVSGPYGAIVHASTSRRLMRMVVTLDVDLMQHAEDLTGIREPSELLTLALKQLVQRQSAKRLAALGGTQPGLKIPPRRRIRGSVR